MTFIPIINFPTSIRSLLLEPWQLIPDTITIANLHERLGYEHDLANKTEIRDAHCARSEQNLIILLKWPWWAWSSVGEFDHLMINTIRFLSCFYFQVATVGKPWGSLAAQRVRHSLWGLISGEILVVWQRSRLERWSNFWDDAMVIFLQGAPSCSMVFQWFCRT